VQLELVEATGDVQLQALARGEIDAGFMLHSPGFAPPAWRTCGSARSRWCWRCPSSIRWQRPDAGAGRRAGRAAGDFSAPHRAVAARRHFGLYHAAGHLPQVAQEAIQMQTIVNLVSAGLGVAWVPESVRQFQRPGVVYRASLLLYFAAGSTRYQSHEGTLLVCGRSTTAPHNAHVDGVPCAAK
jgi:DNA-binding transcriptional LysR family regulator